jgi:hypothetical protein
MNDKMLVHEHMLRVIKNCLENVGALTSHNPTDFQGLLQE